MVLAGRAAHCAGAVRALTPLRVRGLAHTVSLAPGVASCPPGGLGMGADDLPTTSWRRTQYIWQSPYITS
jgi:hypothetical protein